MRVQAIPLAALLAIALEASGQGPTGTPIRQGGVIGYSVRPPGEYGHLTGVLFAVGVVTDIDLDTTCEAVKVEPSAPTDCLAQEQLQMRVLVSSQGLPAGSLLLRQYPPIVTLLLQLPSHDQSSREADRIQVGDVIAITYLREDKPKSWSCGRLQACHPRPPAIYFALELFKRALWP